MSENKENFVERQIVLGAGASFDGGFPSGNELKNKIIDLYENVKNENNYTILENDSETNHEETEKKKFCKLVKELLQNFKLSFLSSIDSFLVRSANSEVNAAGCALIVAIIRYYQKQKKNIEWYGDLIPLFFPSIDVVVDDDEVVKNKFKKHLKKIKVITFNYDVSLEYFLYDYFVRNYFIGQEEELFKLIQNRILHVYGSIYKKDVLLTKIKEIRESEIDEIYSKQLDDLKKGLLENLDNNKILNEAYKVWRDEQDLITVMGRGNNGNDVSVESCDYLYILGFGFDPLNIEKIGLKKDVWKKNCFVTNFSDNQKIKRIALNTLARSSGGNDWLIPIISKSTIKKALEADFSLVEESQSSEKIPANQSLNGSSSPYFAVMKYDTIKTNNEK